MTLTLELPQELEFELAAEAASGGLSLPDYVLQLLTKGRTAPVRPKTGAEIVAYWQAEGLIGTRPDIKDSQKHARKLRAKASRRKRN